MYGIIKGRIGGIMKRLTLLISILFLVIVVSSVVSTFAYYVDKHNMESNFDIAKWVIKVNDTDITLSDNHEFSVNDITLNIPDSSIDGLKVSNNVFAPGTTGSFNLLLDLSEVDTSIEYDLVIDTSNIDETNINIVSVVVQDSLLELVDSKYSKRINVDDLKNNKEELITVNFEWVDSQDYDDSLIEGSISIPVSIEVRQVME